MKKVFLVLAVISLAFTSCSSDDDNDNDIIYPENIYEGSVVLNSPIDIEQFGLLNYTTITGSLTISDPENEQHITNLDPLISLTHIDGNLNINNNPHLTDLSGLNNLTKIGSIAGAGKLYIQNNLSLTHLNGLENLTSSYGTSEISNNESLVNFCGLINFTSNLTIYDNAYNPTLEDIQNGNCSL